MARLWQLCLLCSVYWVAGAPVMPFAVLQYNLFGRPYVVSHDGQNERLQRIPEAVLNLHPDIDVACFAEADNEQETALLATAFAKAGYNYRTSVVTDHDDKSLINGGVLISSKWPILREDQIVYRDACNGADCLAAKGVKYARVIKTDLANRTKIFNIFATHMQAWYTADDKADRAKQAKQLKAFIDSQQIPASEPVLISGDFNTDWVRYPGEVASLIGTLNATVPTLTGDSTFSSDPSTNLLVGRDGAAGDCSDAYTRSWGAESNKTYIPSEATRVVSSIKWPPATDTGAPVLPFFQLRSNLSYCPCCPQEWLDYVLSSVQHQQPTNNPTMQVVAVKSATPFAVPWAGTLQPVPEPPVVGAYIDLSDLSDHYPVYAAFEFEVEGPAVPAIDGCRQDSDCSFHTSLEASCYCDGSGCTWNGLHRDGWKAGASDPVNANCHYHLESLLCVCHKE